MTLIRKVDRLEQSSTLEESIADFIASHCIYTEPEDSDRAWGIADMDYEIIIRPKS